MKKIKLNIEDYFGDNAYLLLGKFEKQARKEGWNKNEIQEVLNKAKSGNYNHLMSTLKDYCDEE